MQLIWVLPALAALAMALPSDMKEKLTHTQQKEQLEQFKERFRGRMSNRTRKTFETAMEGVNLDARKARLERMASMGQKRKPMNDEERQAFRDKIKSIRKVNMTELPPSVNSTDLFQLNQQLGVGDYLFQGDIHLTDDQMADVEYQILTPGDISLRRKRQATTVFPKWTGGNVYYYLDASINARKSASITGALAYLQSRTCINFIKSSTNANRIRVFNGAGCYSTVGMVGGRQDLSLGDGCEVIGTVAHEFTHALGIWHMQMRSDRDNFVTIDTSTIDDSKAGNFVKLNANEMTTYTPYEYGSFMHYGANSFVNRPDQISIVPKDTKYVYTMGNRQISFFDIKMINDFYGCSAKCVAATSAQCKNGGTPNPRNCATCNCPLGFGGALCDQRPAGCGEELTASSDWQTKQFTFGNTADSKNIRDDFTLCNHWIKAPAGMKVQVKVTSMVNPQCQYGCPFNGIEIKTNVDPRVTNPRYCCPEFNNIELTSELNPTPVVSYNRYYFNTFTIQYRYIASTGPLPTVAPAVTKTTTTTPVPRVVTTTKKTRVPSSITSTKKTPAPSAYCANTLDNALCALNVASGFCTSPRYSFQIIKYNCARACGLCGKAANPCVDLHAQCAQIKAAGLCTRLNPIEAEYNCARTCGFCTNPV